MDKLSQLRRVTQVVADTGDVLSIQALKPIDATTNPSLIMKSAADPLYQTLIDEALSFAEKKAVLIEEQVTWAARKVAVNFGVAILKQLPGRISTEVDAHFSFNMEASIQEAEILMDLYAEEGVSADRILVKLASTWEGIQAAKKLEQRHIHCNLTLLFSFAQARAAAEAGVTLISPFVGRIYDWYREKEKKEWKGPEDPGVQSVKKIFEYYKTHHYPTIIMGASFRNTAQIEALAGCDYLTISPALLAQLAQEEGVLVRALESERYSALQSTRPHPITESEFRFSLNQDAMATEKLAEGIRIFCQDLEHLKHFLRLRLLAHEA